VNNVSDKVVRHSQAYLPGKNSSWGTEDVAYYMKIRPILSDQPPKRRFSINIRS